MSETNPPANQPTNQPTNQPATQPPAESGPRLVNGLTPEQRAERHRDADALCWRSVRCHLGAVALVIIVWLNSEFAATTLLGEPPSAVCGKSPS